MKTAPPEKSLRIEAKNMEKSPTLSMSHTLPFENLKQDVDMSEELKINRNELYYLKGRSLLK